MTPTIDRKALNHFVDALYTNFQTLDLEAFIASRYAHHSCSRHFPSIDCPRRMRVTALYTESTGRFGERIVTGNVCFALTHVPYMQQKILNSRQYLKSGFDENTWKSKLVKFVEQIWVKKNNLFINSLYNNYINEFFKDVIDVIKWREFIYYANASFPLPLCVFTEVGGKVDLDMIFNRIALCEIYSDHMGYPSKLPQFPALIPEEKHYQNAQEVWAKQLHFLVGQDSTAHWTLV